MGIVFPYGGTLDVFSSESSNTKLIHAKLKDFIGHSPD